MQLALCLRASKEADPTRVLNELLVRDVGPAPPSEGKGSELDSGEETKYGGNVLAEACPPPAVAEGKSGSGQESGMVLLSDEGTCRMLARLEKEEQADQETGGRVWWYGVALGVCRLQEDGHNRTSRPDTGVVLR